MTQKLEHVASTELRPGFWDETIKHRALTELDFRIENTHDAIYEGTSVMTTAAAMASQRRRLVRGYTFRGSLSNELHPERHENATPRRDQQVVISNDKEPFFEPLPRSRISRSQRGSAATENV